MPRFLEIRRHSLKFKEGEGNTSLISPEGVTLAERVGQEYMKGFRYAGTFASPLARTSQTMAAFQRGAGLHGINVGPAEMPLLGADVEEWVRLCARGENIVAISGVDPVRFAQIADTLADLYHAMTRMLPDSGRGLVVSHTPAIETAVFGLTLGEVVLGPLRECEGVLLRFDGNIVTVEHEFRLP